MLQSDIGLDYLNARSICYAAGWDCALITKSLEGDVISEIDKRVELLNVRNTRAALRDAALVCRTASEERTSRVKLLASRPSLVQASGHEVSLLGGEWLELVRHATRSLIIITPFVDESALNNLLDSLAAAIKSGVAVSIVVGDDAVAKFSISTVRAFLPRLPGLAARYWPSENGRLHAKVFAADDNVIYVGSANVTDYGWRQNVEVGITLRGPIARPLALLTRFILDGSREIVAAGN